MVDTYEVVEVVTTVHVLVHVVKAKGEQQAKDFVECNRDCTTVYEPDKPGYKVDRGVSEVFKRKGTFREYPISQERGKYGAFNPSGHDLGYEEL